MASSPSFVVSLKSPAGLAAAAVPTLKSTPMPAAAPAPAASRALPVPGFPGGAEGLPDVTIPLRFLVTGLIALFAGIGLLIARPDFLATYHYNQYVVAETHLLLLGFVLSVVMGATYQLVPVALETRLYSERLARWHYPIHLLSVAGMVWMFWIWDMKQVGHFGSGLALGVGLFLWNMGRTLLRVRGWTVVSLGIASSLFWLGAVIVAGLAVAAAKSTYELVGRPGVPLALSLPLAGLKATADFLAHFESLAVMHAHAHLGVLGVFVLITVAVAYKLVPMFLISEVQSPRRAGASLLLLNVGMLAVFLTVIRQSAWKPVAGLIVVAGLALYGRELAAIVAARKRRELDWGLRGFLVAQSLLALAAALGLFLSWPRLPQSEAIGRVENAYGLVAVLGVIAFAIVSMLYKIVPFLVWFAAYGRLVGRARTPALHQMYSAPVQATGFWLWIAALATSLVGVGLGSEGFVRAGAILFAASLATLAFNVLRILGHLWRPRVEPFATGRPVPATSSTTTTPSSGSPSASRS